MESGNPAVDSETTKFRTTKSTPWHIPFIELFPESFGRLISPLVVRAINGNIIAYSFIPSIHIIIGQFHNISFGLKQHHGLPILIHMYDSPVTDVPFTEGRRSRVTLVSTHAKFKPPRGYYYYFLKESCKFCKFCIVYKVVNYLNVYERILRQTITSVYNIFVNLYTKIIKS